MEIEKKKADKVQTRGHLPLVWFRYGVFEAIYILYIWLVVRFDVGSEIRAEFPLWVFFGLFGKAHSSAGH